MECDWSSDGLRFAALAPDGRLRVWDAPANRLLQEFTPDHHLAAPLTCLRFCPPPPSASASPAPPPGKRRRSAPALEPDLALGTASGALLVYSVAQGTVVTRLEGAEAGGQRIHCVDVTPNGGAAFTGGEGGDVVEWALRKGRRPVARWKVGGERVSAVLFVEGHGLLTACRSIALWGPRGRQLLRRFSGHRSEVARLLHLTGSYVVSAGREDRLLSCWNLSPVEAEESEGADAPVVGFLAEDAVVGMAALCPAEQEGGRTALAAATRSGAVHVFRHAPNGRCERPVRPATTVRVVKQEAGNRVVPLPVLGAWLRDGNTLALGHGSMLVATFEDVRLDFDEAVQCLVRKDPLAVMKAAEQDKDVAKVKKPIVGNQVHHVSTDMSVPPSVAPTAAKKRVRGPTKQDVPIEQRLEQLLLEGGEVPAAAAGGGAGGVARLLTQGLRSGDEHVLREALAPLPEPVVRRSLQRLPAGALPALASRLALLLRGKTARARTAALWTRCLLQTRAAHLAADPDLVLVLAPALTALEARLALRARLDALRGRLGAALEGR